MLEVDAAAGTLTLPIWAAGATSAVFLAVIVLAIGRAGAAAAMNVLFRVALVAIAVSAGWLYFQRIERQDRAAELRQLDERSAALLVRAVAPGSALSCLDELAGEAVEAACEKAVFSSPEAVSAAVAYVTAKLALLADRNDYARRLDPALASGSTPLLTALEIDRFGIVAHVLATRHGCTAGKCDALTWFGDDSRVLANLRDHTFNEQVAKFAANWNGPPRATMDRAATDRAAPDNAPAELPRPAAPALTVAPRYDFPSAESIPPVNIMAPEPAPRPAAPPNGQPAAASRDANPRPAAPPVPPRRPPQARTPAPPSVGSRPPSPRPAAPVAVGEAPTDGASMRSSGAGPAQ
jgi:hypothetical protein